jgi:hypothetical protein
MVRPTTLQDLEKELTDDLLGKSNPLDRCPNLKADNSGPYCGRDLKEGEAILDQRRAVCDNYSLQLWCLDNTRCSICLWYKGEPFELTK